MAEKRRLLGSFNDAVLRLLVDRPRPLSAAELAEKLNDEGHTLAMSQVHRALRLFIDSGQVRKVHLAAGYAVAGAGEEIDLTCRNCGRVANILDPETFARLRSASEIAGYEYRRAVVEVDALCGDCGRGDG